ncbi:MAG: ShlB/FhaC/HecB family hemolysin secretion/activation protein [Methylocystaceae bacterium]|nr:MAG: ShlB/FhaC/HecB family hemolysin secretion/activation protein [Methylocystaceae bacterium]
MNFRVFIASCGALQATMLAAPSASAQSVPPYNIGDAVRQAEESRQAPPARPAAAPVLPRLAEPQLTLADKETLLVRKFELEGPRFIDEAETREILAPYENRKLTLAEIYAAADKITTLYRSKGYLVAKVYVPAQDARRGVLRFKLVPGRYGAIAVKNESLVADEFLRNVIDGARDEAPLIHKDELERAMLLVSDLPGAGAPRIAISPGQKPETSDLLFTVPEGRRFEGYLLGDNFGSPFTGRDRLTGGVSVNSPLGYGDRLSASGIVSEHANLANGRVAYSFPLGHDGLRAEVGAFRTTYALTGVYKDLDATGSAYAVTATLTYALKRQRDESIYVWTNFTHKWLNDRIAGSSTADRTIALGTVAVTRDTAQSLFGLPLTTSATLSFTAGYVDFADPTQKAANIAGADTAGNYYRINLALNSIVALNEKLSLSTSLKAQKSLVGNLDSSEQMSVAGFWGVRSYDEGLAGDSAYVVTPELKYALPEFYGYRHSIGLFTDVGAAWLENGSYTTTQKSYTQLNDVGLGYYATYEYSSGRFLLMKGQVAHTYGSHDGAASYDRRTKGLVQVGLTF